MFPSHIALTVHPLTFPESPITVPDISVSEVCAVPPDPILEKLHGWLDAEWTGTATELVQILSLELKPNALTRYLNVNTGRLENEYGIVYQNARTHSGRVVTLKRIQPSP